MTDHIKTKHKLQNVPTKLEFNSLLEQCILSDKERQLMQMYYVDKKDFDYIADIMGYSKSGILRMHKRILKKVESLF